MSRVLVTGGTGFLGSRTILQLLAAGFQVRATIRSSARETGLREALAAGGAGPDADLSVAVTDLEQDSGWAEAVKGCEYVVHVASPFPSQSPANEDELLRPARDGTLRVLRAARDAGVRRVVVTSSFGAIGYGHPRQTAPFTESDWTDLGGSDVQPYVKSKTLAERAAWDFVRREGGALELAVVNPVGIFGPVLSRDYSSSIGLVRQLMVGAMPAVPRLYFGVVDVRDAAGLHLLAMTHPAAAGERFIATAGPAVGLHEIALALRARLGASARRVPRWEMPIWVTRLLALRSPTLRPMVPQLGIVRNASNARARTVLGWSPRSAIDAVVATAQSLVDRRLLAD